MLYHQFVIATECQFFYNCDGIIACSSPKNLWEYRNKLQINQFQRCSPSLFKDLQCSVAQWCPTLCNRMDYSPPGSSDHGILQARILEWGAISSSRGSSPPRDRTHISCISCTGGRFFTTRTLGSPIRMITCTIIPSLDYRHKITLSLQKKISHQPYVYQFFSCLY